MFSVVDLSRFSKTSKSHVPLSVWLPIFSALATAIRRTSCCVTTAITYTLTSVSICHCVCSRWVDSRILIICLNNTVGAGHFLGNFKKKFGIKRETAPFVFTHQFAAVLGGSKRNSDGTYVSKHYQDFVDLCKKAFVAVRRHSSLLISLFNLMVASGIDQISNFEDVQWLRDR